MAVYLAAILTFGFYASAVPVKFALLLRVGGGAGFGAGSAAFEGRYALRQAERRARGERKRLPRRRAGADARKFSLAAAMLRRLLRDTRVESLRLRGSIGLPDAAQTALACGIVRATEAALGAALAPAAVRFDVNPDFAGSGSELMLTGMFSIRAGHIMLGALLGAGEYAYRRVREWTDIPLKIS